MILAVNLLANNGGIQMKMQRRGTYFLVSSRKLKENKHKFSVFAFQGTYLQHQKRKKTPKPEFPQLKTSSMKGWIASIA